MSRRLPRLIRRRVIHRIRIHNLILHGSVAVEEGTCCGPAGLVGAEAGDGFGAGGEVEAEDGAVEQGERGEGLVKGDFVPGLEDAGEGEVCGLFQLARGWVLVRGR